MTLQEFWDGNEKLAIHCDTEEKAKRLCEEFNKIGKKWSSRQYYSSDNEYEHYKNQTCYTNRRTLSSLSHCIERNIKIVEFDDIDDFKSNTDQVNYPSHYTDGNIEVIDFIEDKKLGFHLGNAVKYIVRAGKKDSSKTKDDIKKAIWYLERYLEALE